MLNSIKTKDLGVLARSALTLEEDFKEIERLNAALAKFREGTETNLDHAQKLLNKFGEVGLRIGEEIQLLAKALDEGRQRAELATQGVAESAAFIRKRQEESSSIFGRFQSLVTRAQEISASLAHIGRGGGSATNEDKTAFMSLLPELEQKLGALADDASQIKDEARIAHLKDLERDAEAMVQNLRTTHQKIKNLTNLES